MDLYDYDLNQFVDREAEAFDNFVSNFYNKTLTKDDLLSLANSGYDVSRLADTLSVDADALSNAISGAQTQDVLDKVDPTDGFSKEEQDAVAQLLTEDKIGLGDITKQYDLDTMDVIEGVLRGGYETPAEMVERLAPYNEGLTEVDLITNLLAKGRTTPEEIAAYYGNNPAYPEYEGLTAEEVAAYAASKGIEGYEDGGRVMFDQYGRTNPPPGAFITEISTKNPMGPPDPSSDEFLQLIEALDRQRYRKSTRTIPELLRDILDDYAYAKPREHAGTLQRMRFNRENPDFLDRLEDMKEARQRVLDVQEGYAAGGMASLDGMGQGYYLGGPTDGMADLVPATIDGTQPAALSDGEFVIPADVVSHLGNGNSEAGAQQLYSMMDRVREERTGTTRQGPEINPTKMMPA